MTIIIPSKEVIQDEKAGRFREKEVHVRNWNTNKSIPCPDCCTTLKHPYRCVDCRLELAIILEN